MGRPRTPRGAFGGGGPGATGRRGAPGGGRALVARGEVWWYEHPEAGRRPFLVLTRSEVVPALNQVIGAPATTVVRGIPTEVPLDEGDGMPRPCVLSLDNTTSIRRVFLTERVTQLGPEKMHEVCRALSHATAC